ncbi:hypothetical protein [Legionella fallonii]|uniref:Uncharacterized protein n=1 Tax=Legionella fallonii LLAP-10 TaxID=1212491 RepID=A0A098G206_9GAMM|nr:hypothetical protein [Legionella fallonii]CEG56016.1 protein of unknown function [Legionella fallonii LLAP-10]
MPSNNLSITDRYLSSFRSRNDDFSYRAIRILTAFQKELTHNTPELNSAYTDLGYHYWLNHFDKIEISSKELPSYLLMQKFIDEIEKSGEKTTLTALFKRFNEEALMPALKKYQEALYSSLSSLTPTSLRELETIYNALDFCLENHLGNRLEQIKRKGSGIIQQLQQQFSEVGLTLELIKDGFNAAIDVASENQDLLVVGMFMTQFKIVLTNQRNKTSDLLSLKEIAKEAEKHLLEMPEIKEVKQFHWLINLFCNFVNNYIVYAFESQQRKDVNRFFKQWNEVINEAENQELYATIQSSR